MQTITDQTGITVTIPDSPIRIISLVPSQTELLADLGLDQEVVGITKFCIHPEAWFRSKQRVGGTKKLDMEMIRSLKPDLIIANKEENEKSQIETLEKEFPVWISDIKTFREAKQMILAVGEMTKQFIKAIELLKKIDAAFDDLRIAVQSRSTKRIAYLIWKEPLMAAGGDTFINSILEACQLQNVFNDLGRYPEISRDQMKAAKPDVILLSSEPFPFTEKHALEFNDLFPGIKVLPVDGELFSWYGSRLQYAPPYFLKLLEQIETLK